MPNVTFFPLMSDGFSHISSNCRSNDFVFRNGLKLIILDQFHDDFTGFFVSQIITIRCLLVLVFFYINISFNEKFCIRASKVPFISTLKKLAIYHPSPTPYRVKTVLKCPYMTLSTVSSMSHVRLVSPANRPVTAWALAYLLHYFNYNERTTDYL